MEMKKTTLIVLILILTSCESQTGKPLEFASNSWPGYAPIFLADNLGYYQQKNIHLTELASTTDVMHALKTGVIDAAGLTLDETLNLIDENQDLKVIMVFDISNGADAVIAKPHIQTLTELKSATIGVEFTAVGAILLNALLVEAELSLTDINVETCLIDEQQDCFNDVNIDAVVTFEPVKTKLMNMGGHIIFDSSSIKGLITDVLVVRADAIDEYHDELSELVVGYFKALEYMQTNTDHAYQLIARQSGITTDELKLAYKGLKLIDLERNRQYFKTDNKLIMKKINKLTALMLEHDFLNNKTLSTNIVDGDFILDIP